MRRLALLLPLPFLVVLAAWSSSKLADAAALRVSGVLHGVALALAQAETRDTGAEVETELAPQTIPVAAAAPANPPAKPSKKRGTAKAPAASRGVFISADTVLKLANRRALPRGVQVKADGKRPAGLRLANVGALGVGLRDGDVLTRAMGLPALSSGAVVQAVLMARAQRARFLDGEFWRDGERYTLRVEQPYPKAP